MQGRGVAAAGKRGNVIGINRLSPALLGLVIANAAVFVAGLVHNAVNAYQFDALQERLVAQGLTPDAICFVLTAGLGAISLDAEARRHFSNSTEFMRCRRQAEHVGP